ncbi:outer membrane protein assembly factor BamB family protein [Mycolicibacterium arseniciresistens]|uniref:outer membrane protein assembly factor BamB family protein n=1 Tax=Mycolicibacterium arseniciresistens TaxID=3062257 RepID=UPI002E1C4D52
MSKDSATAGRRRRFGLGVAVGLAVSAAVPAVVAPVVMWIIRSPADVTSHSLTTMGVIAAVAGVWVFIAAVPRLIGRDSRTTGLMKVAGFVAAAVCAWALWMAFGVFRARDGLPFVDSTGASILAVTAVLCAVVATVCALATAAVAGPVSGRTACCVALVVLFAVPIVSYRTVADHRGGVWAADLIAKAAPLAATPDAVGPVRYEIPLDDGENLPGAYGAGNGFVVDTRREITAYDGRTGEKRWHATDYGTSGRLLVVRRDRDDRSGIVVVFLYHAVIAFDGGTGEVLWRREYSSGGKVTAATGSVDALGMAVFTADAAVSGSNSRTRLHSLDPATGRERWSQPISCSNPTLHPGTPGQFAYDCSKPSLIDAHTGVFTDVPGEYAPRAGTDVYVASFTEWDDRGSATDKTLVMDPDGRVVDEMSGATAVSTAHNGFLLVHSGGTWMMRDYRSHRSTPVPLGSVPVPTNYERPNTAWLDDRLLIAAEKRDAPLFLVDPARPTQEPLSSAPPCPGDETVRDLQVVAGAVVAQCDTDRVVGGAWCYLTLTVTVGLKVLLFLSLDRTALGRVLALGLTETTRASSSGTSLRRLTCTR